MPVFRTGVVNIQDESGALCAEHKKVRHIRHRTQHI